MPRIAWVGMGLLLIAAMLLSLGRRETQAFPAADSFAPSGASAFAELLRSEGYKVVEEKSLRPRLLEGDLAVSFRLPEEVNPMSVMDELEKEESESQLSKAFNREFVDHLVGGGKSLILPLSREYLVASRELLTQPAVKVRPATGQGDYTVNFTSTTHSDAFLNEFLAIYPRIGLWLDERDQPVITGVKVSKGVAFVASDGAIATNRFIDRNDNAAFLLRLIQTMAPKGSRIVFTEASHGNVQEKGLLEAIGPWADAAWQQFLILALVVAYTVGKRLGLPEESHSRQRGTRELVDAIAATMQRAQKPRLAMRVALKRADAELRAALKLPRDTDRAKRDDLLPNSLNRALAMLEAASTDANVPAWDAARKIKRVDDEIAAFLGARGRSRSRRSRRRPL